MTAIHTTLFGTKLICYENGIIDRFDERYNKWQEVKQTPIKRKNYECLEIGFNGKIYKQARILAHVYYNFDLDSDLQIDHIDRNSLNNSIDNLRIVTNQQNSWNTNAKGYYKRKSGFQAVLQANGICYSKRFKTEEDAIKWHNMMKSAFHTITKEE